MTVIISKRTFERATTGFVAVRKSDVGLCVVEVEDARKGSRRDRLVILSEAYDTREEAQAFLDGHQARGTELWKARQACGRCGTCGADPSAQSPGLDEAG